MRNEEKKNALTLSVIAKALSPFPLSASERGGRGVSAMILRYWLVRDYEYYA
jgi:hypothetical protein